jgi:hypothetical protein
MACVSFDRIPHECVSHQKSGSTRGVLRGFLDAILASQQRRVDREIVRYVIESGRFTDDTEREIERRFLFR